MPGPRVSCFVDGFNLYHAIHDLHENHLKWLNLWALVEMFTVKPYEKLTNVYYFSAFATWLPDAYRRHREYVEALTATGVTPVMAYFKEKDRECRACGAQWVAHEEKETDVNISLYMLNHAYRDEYDRAFLLSADSDLAPVVHMIRKQFPAKPIRLIAPPERRQSKELVAALKPRPNLRSIKKKHLKRFRFPDIVTDDDGNSLAVCPPEYMAPPAP